TTYPIRIQRNTGIAATIATKSVTKFWPPGAGTDFKIPIVTALTRLHPTGQTSTPTNVRKKLTALLFKDRCAYSPCNRHVQSKPDHDHFLNKQHQNDHDLA